MAARLAPRVGRGCAMLRRADHALASTGPVTRTTRSRVRAPMRTRVLLVSATVLAVAGVLATAVLIASGSHGNGPSDPAPALGVNRPGATSFGSLTVFAADATPGSALSQGPAHVAHGAIGLDQQAVDVSVRLSSTLHDRFAAFSPDQFRLLDGSGSQPLVPDSATFESGQLRPGATVEGVVSFVAPLTAVHLWLRYDDASGTPILVDLGLSPGGSPGPPHQH